MVLDDLGGLAVRVEPERAGKNLTQHLHLSATFCSLMEASRRFNAVTVSSVDGKVTISHKPPPTPALSTTRATFLSRSSILSSSHTSNSERSQLHSFLK